MLLKAFSVKINYGKAPTIKEIMWQPLVFNWIKCNIDGAFAYNLGNTKSLVVELNGVMYATELANQKGWTHLWLETDSMLVTLAFKSKSNVPWQLRNRWDDYTGIASVMSFFVTQIYREGNHCADQLANMVRSCTTSN